MWPFNKPQPISGQSSPTLASIVLRPTRLGAGMLVMVALLWLIGVNYQVNLAYVAAFWLLGFLLVGVLLNLMQLLALRIDVAMPQEVFAGQTAVLHLTVPDNIRLRQLWLCNEEEFLNHHKPSEKNLWRPWLVEAGGGGIFEWRIPAVLRGYLHVPPLRTASVAPFGLTMAQCVWHWPSEVIVYPAPIEHQLSENRPNREIDTVDARPVAGGDDLSYLQPYQDGMSLQHVAWKAYAKTGEMLAKRFEELRSSAASHIISYRDYPAGIPRDQLAGMLCQRVLAADRQGTPYILELPKSSIAPQNGQREMCLIALALW